MKWEYLVRSFVAMSNEEMSTQLNDLGRDGWEMCGLQQSSDYDDAYVAHCVFMRQVPDDQA